MQRTYTALLKELTGKLVVKKFTYNDNIYNSSIQHCTLVLKAGVCPSTELIFVRTKRK